MGQRTKPGWCQNCGRSVLGVKTTARTRNAAAGLMAVPTLGLSLLGAKNEQYACPNCGNEVVTGLLSQGRTLQANQGKRGAETQTREAVSATTQPQPLKPLPPRERPLARCPTCTRPIYVGDTECEVGHALRPEWEEEFFDIHGQWPREAGALSRPKGGATSSEPPAAQEASIADELKKLAELREAGALTPEEFDAAKKKLLAD